MVGVFVGLEAFMRHEMKGINHELRMKMEEKWKRKGREGKGKNQTFS